MRPTVSAVVLAAGLSQRMGENKLIKDFRGRPMLEHILNLVESLDFDERILVTTRQTARAVKIPEAFPVVINENPEQGQGHSVSLGARAATGDYIMFFAGDMPLLTALVVRALLDAARASNGKIVAPEVNGGLSNPVIFPKALRGELMGLSGSEGGRRIMREHADMLQTVPFSDPLPFSDTDTPEDFLRLQCVDKYSKLT